MRKEKGLIAKNKHMFEIVMLLSVFLGCIVTVLLLIWTLDRVCWKPAEKEQVQMQEEFCTKTTKEEFLEESGKVGEVKEHPNVFSIRDQGNQVIGEVHESANKEGEKANNL